MTNIQKLQELSDYRESPAINQSTLKRAIGTSGPPSDSTAMLAGSLVDCLLFTPDLFDHLFFIQRESYEPAVEKLADLLVEHIQKEMDDAAFQEIWKHNYEDARDDLILWACEEIGFQPRWGAEAKLRNLTDLNVGDDAKKNLHLIQCVNDKLDAFGKKTVTVEARQEAQVIARRAAQFIFDTYADLVRDEWTYVPQQPVYFTYEGHPCKGLLDCAWYSPSKATPEIIPVDFKLTNYSLRSAHYQLRKMRTDFQAAFYSEGLAITNPNAFIHKFEIIMYSTVDDAFERIILSEEDLLVGKYGMKRTEQWPVTKDQHIIREKSIYGFHDAFRFLDVSGAEYRRILSHNNNSIWF